MIHVLAFACLLGTSAATFCDTAGSACESEDGALDLDTSLLQVGVQYHEHAKTKKTVDEKVHTKGSSKGDPCAGDKVALDTKSTEVKSASKKPDTDDHPMPARDISAEATLRLKSESQESTSASARAQQMVHRMVQRAREMGHVSIVLICVAIAIAICVIIGFIVGRPDDTPMEKPKVAFGNTSTRQLSSAGSVRAPGSSTPLTAFDTHPMIGSPKPTPVQAGSALLSNTKQAGSAVLSSTSLPKGSITKESKPQAPPPEPPSFTNAPPPVCPNLILPHTEARFVISMNSLTTLMHGSLDILGTSGRKLLHAAMEEQPDGRTCLALSSCGHEDDPRICIFSAMQDTNDTDLEVYGKQGQFYGHLSMESGSGRAILHHGDGTNPVMYLELGHQEDLRVTATALDGNLLASAGRNTSSGARQVNGSDAWKMQVKPGVDAILVTSCMLVLILFKR